MSSERLSRLFTWRSALCESGLPPTARHVGLTLSLHMSERGDSAFPSVSTLAEETGLARRSVQRHLRALQGEGRIEPDGWASYQTAGGEQRTRRYRAAVPDEQGGDTETPPAGKGASEDREGGGTVTPKDDKEDVSKNTTTEVGDSSSDDSESPPAGEEDDSPDTSESDDTPDSLENPLSWIEATPATEKAPTAHWTDGVRALWWGQDEDPFERGVGATMRNLATKVESRGASHIDGSRYVVGCHLLRERGEHRDPYRPCSSDPDIQFHEPVAESLSERTAPLELDMAGTGCLLVRRRVFEALSRPWFVARADGVIEDYNFTLRATDAGFKAVLDPTVEVGHIGAHEHGLEDSAREYRRKRVEDKKRRLAAGIVE